MTKTFTRQFDQHRKAQGFSSQAQLDAFFAHYDHVSNCADCAKLDGYVLLSDGYQPTQGECESAQALYRAYLERS